MQHSWDECCRTSLSSLQALLDNIQFATQATRGEMFTELWESDLHVATQAKDILKTTTEKKTQTQITNECVGQGRGKGKHGSTRGVWRARKIWWIIVLFNFLNYVIFCYRYYMFSYYYWILMLYTVVTCHVYYVMSTYAYFERKWYHCFAL